MTSTLSTESVPATAASTRSMSIEDFVGRLLMLLWFTTASWMHITQMVRVFSGRAENAYWFVDFAHSLLLIAFSGLAALLTILRNPVKAVAQGLEPRISALFGTFFVLTLPFLPGSENGVALELIGLPIMFIGLAASIFCMAWLGKSFSIMATARELKVTGPYGIVRHPLYATELIAVLGVVLSSLSVVSVTVLVLVTAFQVRRTYNEERVLRSAFPEYEHYARHVPRIIPRLSVFTHGLYAPKAQ